MVMPDEGGRGAPTTLGHAPGQANRTIMASWQGGLSCRRSDQPAEHAFDKIAAAESNSDYYSPSADLESQFRIYIQIGCT